MAMLRVSGADLYYEERGQGVPILWLQGLGADHTAWSPQLARFAPRYQCLAPDNRGSGHSAPGQVLTLQTMAEDAAALIEARAGGEPAHVVGLSMGASIAQELALLAPQLVRSLVLVAASASIEPRLHELLVAWRAIYPRVPIGEFQRQANLWLFSWRFFEREGAAAGVVAYAERTQAPGEWFVAQIDAAITHNATDRLGTVQLPALVVTGTDDIMVPPRLGRALAALIPGARFVEIPDGGHSVNLEQQRAFNEVVGEFLAAH
jgi:pimeloyl-ACP methyl ester carboxylesterase